MNPTRETRTTETEVARVFKDMELETLEQRDKVLAQGSVAEPEPDVRYIIVLSNSSEPAPTVR